MCVAKKAVADRVPLSVGRLRKREFREFMNAVFDALPPAAESLEQFLAFLRSRATVSPVTVPCRVTVFVSFDYCN